MELNESVVNTQDFNLILSALRDRLNETEKRSLDEKGYVVLENVLDESMLNQIRSAFEQVMKKEGFLTGRQITDEGKLSMGDLIAKQFTKEQVVYHELPSEQRVDNLLNKNEAFDMIYIDVKSLAAVSYILGGQPYKLSRSMLYESGGTLKVIPSDDPASGSLSGEVYVKGAAGSVCVIKPLIPFGETMNQTAGNRRALYCSFTTRTKTSEFNQLEYLRRSTFLRISPLAKYILNV